MRSLFEVSLLPLPFEFPFAEAKVGFLRSPNAAFLSFAMLGNLPDAEGWTGANLGKVAGRRGCGWEGGGASRARGLNPTSSGGIFGVKRLGLETWIEGFTHPLHHYYPLLSHLLRH